MMALVWDAGDCGWLQGHLCEAEQLTSSPWKSRLSLPTGPGSAWHGDVCKVSERTEFESVKPSQTQVV